MKEKQASVFVPKQRPPRLLSVFRTCVLFSLLLVFTLPARAFSQVTKVTLKMQNATLSEILEEVRNRTEFRFLYRIEELNKYGKRDIHITQANIDEFLHVLLEKTELEYETDNDVIIIRPRQKNPPVSPAPIKIKGKVTDHHGTGLPGATLLIKGSTLGITTDANGNFELEVPDIRSLILQVSFIGMQTQEVSIGKPDQELIIRLQPDIKEIEEVIVTGYGNVSKESFTGSSVTIKNEELLKVSKTNVIKALQAFDPSFRIQTNNLWGSDPNAIPEMYIRGRSGIGVKKLDPNYTSKGNLKNNPNLPTFIMDGFEISVQKLYDMDPARIASITILKDAAATALYGSRAANGVVVITTHAPKAGKLNVSYSLTGEITFPDLSDYNLMNAREKLQTEEMAGMYHSGDPDQKLKMEKIYNQKMKNIVRGVDTYWLSLPLHTAFNHKHSLFAEGGSDNLRFGVELSYYNEDGVMKSSFRDRLGAGIFIDYRIGNLQVKNQTTFNLIKSRETPYGSFSDYTRALPYNVYKDENGHYLEALEDWEESTANPSNPNPMYEASLKNFDRSAYEELINNLSVNWSITPHWLLKGQISITRQTNKSRRFLDPLSKQNTQPLTSYNVSSGELHTSDGNSFNWDLQATLSYNRSFKKHHLNFILGVNQRATQTQNISAEYWGFPSGELHSPNYAERIYQKPATSENSTRLVGFLGTLNYSWNNIWLADASIRMDGSSEFGSDKRFAPFGSFGLGVNIHNYEFLQASEAISKLKLRATYGETGKVNFPPYVARTTYQIIDEWYKTGFGATLMALGNKKLTWETTKEYNLGLEISLWEDLLYLEGSYYNKRTVDLVNQVTIPSSTGFTTYTDNIGEIENKGFEINLRSNLIRRPHLYVAVFANLAHNKNKILKISESLKAYNDAVDAHFKASEGTSEPFTKYIEGGSLTSIFGMQSLGIDPANGKEIFVKKDGRLTDQWNASEQVILGNEEPDAQGSFGFNISYKNLSLYTTFMYEFGGQTYNQTLVDKVEDANIYTDNVDKRVLTDRWQKPGDIKKFKKLNMKDENHLNSFFVPSTKPTARFVQNNNVISLNSVTLGYELRASDGHRWMQQAGLSMLRFEAGANDLFRWSTVKAERGLNYPYARTINFSLNLSF